ncbi:NAD-dependent epimerase/dehydratase family protein [Nocardia sp. NBC_00565]|uniref:NAD-dependent epimerase/dehydratase family protein n=1 Tax=Nocardia sp. NBC_00565 TaxID=2975993 RepID=UPI002E8033EB|nr:NAD-dependent epimerase/dehydratase family protein [Nocardia sp. NBC_00565]WUC04698.1 NAD-dependent epimerase/dehydratase family protein [Nocardia sp. NBC_00565]
MSDSDTRPDNTRKSLVIGATGFLGSHVVRELVARGEQVRVLVRPSSNTRPLDGLAIESAVGELTDTSAVESAVHGCSIVYYCAVDTRAWLTDPAPLYATNVDTLRVVLDVAIRHPLDAFVFTSTMSTIGRHGARPADEDDEFDWATEAGHYVRTRVAAEELVLGYARDHGLPAMAMCVANTYGADDWQPTPHGAFVAGAALGRLPFTVSGVRAESVGITDAAHALILAAERGRPGQRYIVAERSIDLGEIIRIAATTTGRPTPRLVLPRQVLSMIGTFGTIAARLTGRSVRLTKTTVRLMHWMPEMSHAKAERELGWQPRPVTEAIRDGARFWVDRTTRHHRNLTEH